MRQAARALARAPLFAAAVVLLLALGIGANTLVFTAVDVLLLRPLAVPHPETLVRLGVQRSPAHISYDHPYVYGRMLRARAQSFSDVLASWPVEMAFASGERVESISGQTVSGNYFSALGLTAALGRVFTDSDEQRDAPVVVLSRSFWQRALAGRADSIGATIRLRGHPFTIIGVLGEGFTDLDLENRPDVWVPMSAWKLWTTKPDNTRAPAQVFLRTREGVSLAQAEAEVRSLYPAMVEADYAGLPGVAPHAVAREKAMRPVLTGAERGVSAMRRQFSGAVSALLGAVAALLLLVCANVGGLMLARAETRRREVAICLSLGASRWTIARRTLAEAFLLSAAGATAGWFVARWCGPVLLRFLPARRPLGIALTPDVRVLVFASVACVLTAALMSILPALHAARTDPGVLLGRQNGRTAAPRIGRTLVVLQVALATVLAAGSLSLARTLEALRAEDPGFRRDNLVVMTVNPRMAGVKNEEIPQVFGEVVRRAESLPGVAGVSLANRALLRGVGFKATAGPAGARLTFADSLNVSLNYVGLSHFDNMGMRLLRGRGFEPSDAGRKPRPAVVSDAFAHLFFPAVDPMGRAFGTGGVGDVLGPRYEIVGVVNDAKYRSMREIPPPTFYELLDDDLLRFSAGMALHVRVRGEPGPVMQQLRAVLRGVGPGLAPTDVATMEQEIETSLWQERLLAALSWVFAALSVALAGIGLFGMLAYSVSRRTREIGIHMAAGATVGRIAGWITREAARTVIPGVVCGLAAYAACWRVIAALAYGVTRWDFVSFTGAVVFVTAAGAAATLVPALRAARIDPWAALREE